MYKITFIVNDNTKSAKIIFSEEVDKETIEKINAIIPQAGFDGHVVIFKHNLYFDERYVFILKWNHFSWEDVAVALSHAVKNVFPKIIFENTNNNTPPE